MVVEFMANLDGKVSGTNESVEFVRFNPATVRLTDGSASLDFGLTDEIARSGINVKLRQLGETAQTTLAL